MSRDGRDIKESRTEQPGAFNRDWFLPAIEAQGSVDECLAAAMQELSDRQALVAAIKHALRGETPRGPDRVTALHTRVRALENTLNFRLGILRPERSTAWFRTPSTATTGPFTTTIISEAIFSPFKVEQASEILEGIRKAWQFKNINLLPFSDQQPNLWRSLITLLMQHETMCELTPPFHYLRLDRLPEGLPQKYHTPSLAAFLLNVNTEVRNVKEKINLCYETLLSSTEQFLAYQDEYVWSVRKRTGNHAADNMREQFRQRRQASAHQVTSSLDREALTFFGFTSYPTSGDLRTKYLALAKQLHPDRNGGDDSQFKMLSRAYEHLSRRMAVAGTAASFTSTEM